MSWYALTGPITKTQYAPEDLVTSVHVSMSQRGYPATSIHKTEDTWFEPQLSEAAREEKKMTVHFDGIRIHVSPSELIYLLFAVQSAVPQTVVGTSFYKVYGRGTTLCLSKGQRDGLITNLQYKMEEAQELVSQGWR